MPFFYTGKSEILVTIQLPLRPKRSALPIELISVFVFWMMQYSDHIPISAPAEIRTQNVTILSRPAFAC